MRVICVSLCLLTFNSITYSCLLSNSLEPPEIQYSPYVWISRNAIELIRPSALSNKQKKQGCKLLYTKNEGGAKRLFSKMLTFKEVDYGYPDQTNFGIFAKKSINKGVVVGIYSGICFVDRHPQLKQLLRKSILEKLSKEEIENIVCPNDYTSIHDFLLEQYTTLKSSEIKTPEKYHYELPSKPNSSLSMFPCNKTYTPMHFVNSCNLGEKGNIELEILDLGIDKKSGIHKYAPCYITTQYIHKGSELLDEYITDIDSLNDFQETAEDEIKEIKAYLNSKQSFTDKLNSILPEEKQTHPSHGPAECICIEKMKPETKPLVG